MDLVGTVTNDLVVSQTTFCCLKNQILLSQKPDFVVSKTTFCCLKNQILLSRNFEKKSIKCRPH